MTSLEIVLIPASAMFIIGLYAAWLKWKDERHEKAQKPAE